MPTQSYINDNAPLMTRLDNLERAKYVKWGVLDTGLLGIYESDLKYLVHTGGDDFQHIPIWGSYIETPDAKIIFDCGQNQWDPEIQRRLNHEGISFGPIIQTEEQTFEKQLDLIGVKPDDIDIVIYGHMHFDHTGYSKLFPKAKHIAQIAELRYACKPDPFMLVSYAPTLYLPLLDQFETINGDAMIVPGVYCFYTPGHTPGTMSLVVLPENGPGFMLDGDSSYTNYNFDNEWPPGFVYEPAAFVDSIKRKKYIMKELGLEAHYCSHDAEQFATMKLSPEWQYNDKK